MTRQGFRVKLVHFISKIHEELVCQYAANPEIVFIGIPLFSLSSSLYLKGRLADNC
jgi:hypothetical protein